MQWARSKDLQEDQRGGYFLDSLRERRYIYIYFTIFLLKYRVFLGKSKDSDEDSEQMQKQMEKRFKMLEDNVDKLSGVQEKLETFEQTLQNCSEIPAIKEKLDILLELMTRNKESE